MADKLSHLRDELAGVQGAERLAYFRTSMNTLPEHVVLTQLGEFYAAGLCEEPASPPVLRYARAYRRWFEKCGVSAYNGGPLYPAGKRDLGDTCIFSPDYPYTSRWLNEPFETKLSSATEEEQRALLELRQLHESEEDKVRRDLFPHTVGGDGYTHAIVNYGRVLEEGLDRYAERVANGLDRAEDEASIDFYTAMTDLLEGVRAWHARFVDAARTAPESERRNRLLEALSQVPFRPARNFYEAVVAYNFVYYLDGCDNPGRMDQVLWPFYERDTSVDHDAARSLIGAFYDNVCANKGWSVALGGTGTDGNPVYQEMTEILLEASHHKYRPSLELRVRDDMPDKTWDLAMDALATGCGQPAFYNERGYLDALRQAELGVSEDDIVKWNGGGCTETMIHGCSNVGSLDCGFNLPLILQGTLERELARDDVQFDGIVTAFKEDTRAAIKDVLAKLNRFFAARAEHRPQPVRSLLMDDCIDKARDFNAGGARYNWSVVNVTGIANVADSLHALREIVFERKMVPAKELLDMLNANFEGHEAARQALLVCAKFGNDLEDVDSLAADIGKFVYEEIMAYECGRGGKFLPSHIMFETFAIAGAQVGATPDGRRAGEPLADSSGPVQGRDRNGPTAMLNSAARLPQHLAAGTPVLNMRCARETLSTAKGRRNIRALIETYFRMGGLQIQISVLDQETLLDALERPEKHENLVVRIGGYSEYFNRLSEDLKREVIKRTEYVV